MTFRHFPRNQDEIEKGKTKLENEASANTPYHFLQPGKTLLRVMPPFSDQGVWFVEFKEHYAKIAGQSHYLVDPEFFGEPSPFSEYGRQIAEEGTEEAIAKARPFRSTNKYLLNVIVLSDPKGASAKDGVKVLKIGKTIMSQLIDFDTDVDGGWGDITNLEAGRVITIDREGTARDTSYKTKAHPNTSNIVETLNEQGIDINQLNLHNLTELTRPKSREELESLLEALKAESEPDAATTVDDVVTASTPPIVPPVSTPTPVPMAPPPVTSNKGGS